MTMVTLMLVPHNSAMLLAGASSDAFGALRSELEHEQIPTIGMAHFSAEAGKVLCVIDVGLDLHVLKHPERAGQLRCKHCRQ